MNPEETRKDVAMRIGKVIQEVLAVPLPQIIPEAELIRDLGADSLELVEVELRLEVEFSVELTDAEEKSIRRVADLIEVYSRRMEGGQQG